MKKIPEVLFVVSWFISSMLGWIVGQWLWKNELQDDGITNYIHDIYGDGSIREVTDPDEATKIVENILEKRLTISESGV